MKRERPYRVEVYVTEQFAELSNRTAKRQIKKAGWYTWSTYGTFDRAVERLTAYLLLERSIPVIPPREFRIVHIRTGQVEFSSALL